jgi:hypothetical protein
VDGQIVDELGEPTAGAVLDMMRDLDTRAASGDPDG